MSDRDEDAKVVIETTVLAASPGFKLNEIVVSLLRSKGIHLFTRPTMLVTA